MSGKHELTAFKKLIISSKFQLAILSVGLIYIQQSLYGLSPEIAAESIVKIAVAYFAARLIEPIAEWAAKRKIP